MGFTGPKGAAGPQGPMGIPGTPGATGPIGPAGGGVVIFAQRTNGSGIGISGSSTNFLSLIPGAISSSTFPDIAFYYYGAPSLILQRLIIELSPVFGNSLNGNVDVQVCINGVPVGPKTTVTPLSPVGPTLLFDNGATVTLNTGNAVTLRTSPSPSGGATSGAVRVRQFSLIGQL
jgi:hypothetical protein